MLPNCSKCGNIVEQPGLLENDEVCDQCYWLLDKTGELCRKHHRLHEEITFEGESFTGCLRCFAAKKRALLS